MTKPRLAIWLLAVYTVVLGALAVMGAPIVAYIFYAALIVQILVHTFWLCPKCINLNCAVNPKSPHFLLGTRDGILPPDAKPMNTTLPVLLLGGTFLIGLAGVWIFSQIVWLFMVVIGGFLVYGYARVSCRMCTNNCVMNPQTRQATR